LEFDANRKSEILLKNCICRDPLKILLCPDFLATEIKSLRCCFIVEKTITELCDVTTQTIKRWTMFNCGLSSTSYPMKKLNYRPL